MQGLSKHNERGEQGCGSQAVQVASRQHGWSEFSLPIRFDKGESSCSSAGHPDVTFGREHQLARMPVVLGAF